MDMQYLLLSGALDELEQRFPDAYSFMQRKCLEAELMHWRFERKMYPETFEINPYRTRRLAELENWWAATQLIEKGGTL